MLITSNTAFRSRMTLNVLATGCSVDIISSAAHDTLSNYVISISDDTKTRRRRPWQIRPWSWPSAVLIRAQFK